VILANWGRGPRKSCIVFTGITTPPTSTTLLLDISPPRCDCDHLYRHQAFSHQYHNKSVARLSLRRAETKCKTLSSDSPPQLLLIICHILFRALSRHFHSANDFRFYVSHFDFHLPFATLILPPFATHNQRRNKSTQHTLQQ